MSEDTGRDVMSEPADPVGTGSVDGFARRFARLREAVERSELSAALAQQLAGDRVLISVDGEILTVGLRSGAWYSYGPGGWLRVAGAPDPRRLLRAERSRRGCHVCGTAVSGEAPCPACSAPPAASLEEASEPAKEAVLRFLSAWDGGVPEPLEELRPPQ